jgi:hypothetical protein
MGEGVGDTIELRSAFERDRGSTGEVNAPRAFSP